MFRTVASVVLFAVSLAVGPVHAQNDAKVLRVPLPDITSLDPQQISDLYSKRVAEAIFEGLYQFDYLASPAKVVPNTATAMPEIGDGGKTWKIRVQPGIHFGDDPAFKGKRRELVAEDYVFSIKRALDPLLKTGGDPAFTDLIVGARPVVDAAKKNGRFDYDAPIEGLRALDRFTLQIRLTDVDYTVLERLAVLGMSAVAREVVEAAGPEILSRPVGTGPFLLREWRRGSRLILDANPGYRTIRFPETSDPALKPMAAAMKSTKLPAIDRVEIAIFAELVPQLLAFEQGALDTSTFGASIAGRLLENGALRPDLARRGVRYTKYSVPAVIFNYFNQEDPVVGGNAPEKIALRRAIAMGFNYADFISGFYGGLAVPANQLLPPGVSGHDATLPNKSLYDPAAARALLDRFGYKDRDGDGYRETPDGKPLVLVQNSDPSSTSRESDTIWLNSMKAIGLRMTFNTQPFGDLMKASKAGQLMMLNIGNRASEPSGYSLLSLLWGKSPPDTNPARFHNADYDAAYEKFLRTPNGPERIALARRMSGIVATYVPIMVQVFPLGTAFSHPWVKGYYPSQFGFAWKYMDIDVAARNRAATR